jgi:hypothetical protein
MRHRQFQHNSRRHLAMTRRGEISTCRTIDRIIVVSVFKAQEVLTDVESTSALCSN